jgi:hypothetical protein
MTLNPNAFCLIYSLRSVMQFRFHFIWYGKVQLKAAVRNKSKLPSQSLPTHTVSSVMYKYQSH